MWSTRAVLLGVVSALLMVPASAVVGTAPAGAVPDVQWQGQLSILLETTITSELGKREHEGTVTFSELTPANAIDVQSASGDYHARVAVSLSETFTSFDCDKATSTSASWSHNGRSTDGTDAAGQPIGWAYDSAFALVDDDLGHTYLEPHQVTANPLQSYGCGSPVPPQHQAYATGSYNATGTYPPSEGEWLEDSNPDPNRLVGSTVWTSPPSSEDITYSAYSVTVTYDLTRVIADTSDTDKDGVTDSSDNCLATWNPDQADFDGDLVGNVCDNCWTISNANQADSDGDGEGDACEIPDSCDDPGITQRLFSTADGTAVLGAAAAPDPDFATFGIAMTWCRSPYGVLVDKGWVTQSDLSGNWLLLGVLDNFGFEPYEKPGSVARTATSVTGTATFGVKASAAGVLLSLAPTGRLLDKCGAALAKYKDWRDLGMSHDKAKDKLDGLLRKHLRDWVDAMDERVFKSLNKLPGVTKNTAVAWTGILSKVWVDVGKDLRGRIVENAVGGQLIVKRLLKKAFKKAEIPLWKPRITLSTTAAGPAGLASSGTSYGLKDSWSTQTTG